MSKQPAGEHSDEHKRQEGLQLVSQRSSTADGAKPKSRSLLVNRCARQLCREGSRVEERQTCCSPPCRALQAALSAQADVSSHKASSSGTLECSGGSGVDDATDGGGNGSAAAAEEGDATPSWSWKRFLLFCGPGLLMSVAYLDPGGRAD